MDDKSTPISANDAERPFALHFPSLAEEVVIATDLLAPSEHRESEYFRIRGIVVDQIHAAGSTSTPSMTSTNTSTKTSKKVKTGIGDWDTSMEVTNDSTKDSHVDHNDDPAKKK